MEKFILERDGQIDFYKKFLPRVDTSLQLEDIISDNNDGVIKGNLLEFKLYVSNLNTVLFQCIKYLSALRLKGKPVPKNILIIELNTAKVWLYDSSEYLNDIEKIYSGAASKNNTSFNGKPPKLFLTYNNQLETEKLINILKENNFTKINIDENCIVGWAIHFYNTVPNSRKEDFIGDNTGKHKTIGEIRKPYHFANYIYPYLGDSNIKFNYLMDKLNDSIQKKNLGAFYTNKLYAQKSLELLRKAISRVPAGNDYIILDRCAGTGILEKYLTDEELSHCIVSTIEYYEYKVLLELIGSKVRHIIPPVEESDTFKNGLVNGADALSEDYINNSIIKKYLDDSNCTIILFENPPYAETTSLEHQRKKQSKKSSTWKTSYVVTKMKEDLKTKNIKGSVSNDLGNVFIWSGFNYYLRQPTDSYIVYSPVKYWKAQHLINKKFLGGFAFNRRHFHTNTDACIMCAYWSNENDDIDKIIIDAFDINKEKKLNPCGQLKVEKIYNLYSEKYYDKRKFENFYENGILTGLNGLEATPSVKRRIKKPIYSKEMLGYLVADSVGFDNPDAKSSLLVAGRYNGNGFYLHKDNYLTKLPMFCASRYISYNRTWTERGRIMKSADGEKLLKKDIESGKLTQFLLKCLLFTCLEKQNHMRSFLGSDNRFYRNELCLDDTNGKTIALNDLENLKLNNQEENLIKQWKVILDLAKKTKKYNQKLTYGVYQISEELDTKIKDNLTNKKIYENIELHSALSTLKKLIKEYYKKEIVPTLFEYQLLK